jgi:DNA-binding MarR family transcriptional regulator
MRPLLLHLIRSFEYGLYKALQKALYNAIVLSEITLFEMEIIIKMNLVDEIVSDWKAQRPDIDCSGKAVVCGLLHCHATVIAALESSLKPLSITPTIFSVLVTIRRKGSHAEVTVKNIMEEILVTSGATSNLLNKLIELDLIKKRKGGENEDTRSSFIKLTSKGLGLVNKAMEIQAACERKLTQQLTQAEKKQLSTLLKKMQTQEQIYENVQ